MQIGDLVKVKLTNPTSTDPNVGVIIQTIQYGNRRHGFRVAKVTLTNGYVATYRLDNLEVLCK